ncbi:MAG TPA: MFS transporter [Chloroflexia bacterium]|nr:MFS transporter [Chloroflexia bacterium]
MKRWRSTGLWQHPDFVKLWSAHTISEFGSRITREGLPLLGVITLGASPGEMALLGVAGVAPVIVVGLLAGVWVDRLHRRPILIITDLGRALLLLAIPLLALLSQLQMWHLYVIAALVGVLTVFFNVADQSYLPFLVGREQVVEGNSKLGVSSSVAEVGGPPMAGVLVQLITAPFAILLDALSFLASAIFVGSIRAPEPPIVASEERPHFLRSIAEGANVLLRNPLLRPLAAVTAMWNFFGGFFGTLITLYAIRDLHLTSGIWGLLVGAGGVGSLIGAIFTLRISRRFGVGPTIIITYALTGALGLFIPLAGGSLPVASILIFIPQFFGDMMATVYGINERSLRQSITPDHLLGRTNASMHFIAGGLNTFGLLVGGVLGDALGPRSTLLIAVIGIMLATLWLVFSPLWKLREVQVEETAISELARSIKT